MRRALSFTTLAVSMIFLLGAAQLAGCSSIASPAAPSTDNGDLTVADVFDAFWTEKGGLATFGPPLEPAHDDNTLLRQTFLNVELVFETRATTSSQIYLAPLGRSLGLAEPPAPAPTKSGARYFKTTGHTLFTGFVQAFDRFGGETTIGDPISEVAFRDGLVVQYFENAGLYREQSAAPTEVHMLAFGLAARSGPDKSPPPGFPAVLPPAIRPRPFAPFLDRYGGEAVFGVPLTDPHLAPDGALEQIYERAALFSPSGEPAEVRLRPLGRAYGAADPPNPRPTDPQAPYFSETGHTLGLAFASFFVGHGGQEVFGLPLGEADTLDGVLSQRFENTVLQYRFDLPPDLAIQLAPLGEDYLDGLALGSSPSPAPLGPSPASPTAEYDATGVALLRTWVEKPILPPGMEQTIFVEILRPDRSPWPGVAPVIVVDAPEGKIYPPVPLTNPEGLTAVTLRLDGLTAGEIVTYDVAVAGEAGIGYATGEFAGGLAINTP
jgi:hypothetical protein